MADLLSRIMATLSYEPSTGEFTYKVSAGRQRAGTTAGTTNSNGYTIVSVDGKKHCAHRLAWLVVHGRMPSLIDHINGVRTDNRITNLREATPSQNVANQATRSKTGSRGVHYYAERPTKPWKAFISLGRKTKNLGSFATKQEAERAYDAAARRAFGQFARTNQENNCGL